ncbi:MAG: phospho-N-acetylmuramoyl-pentapeptide-transferase [Capsulimonadaceae bacterium]|nr:phospho-N-acetylmuramoyl-pentapeptide-transferase [Capsulimonadaceae bacterium]
MIHNILVASISFFPAFLTVLLAGPKVIGVLRQLKYGQTINTYVQQHQAKQGTPTMGGILFAFGLIVALLATVPLYGNWASGDIRDQLIVVVVFIAHFGIGLTDDYLSIKRGKNLGLKARHKMAAQIVLAALFALYVVATSPADLPHELALLPGSIVHVPQGIYAVLVVLLMVTMSNFTNLTDGLDGLASGLAILVAAGLAGYASFTCPGIAAFGWALSGALLGFLVYNGQPARVFMGDTGSLALGASLTAMAVLAHSEVVFLIFSLVFIAEGMSVVIQVASFKLTGKRVFLMSPLHHHFEKLGWTESQIVLRFWIAGVIALALGMMAEQRFIG